jgi:Uma2 family endonuclease
MAGVNDSVGDDRINSMEWSPNKPAHFTVDEYLRLEAGSVQRHEYRDGQIIAMAGGTPDHSLIIANLIGELRNRLRGKPCRVYDSNLRVRIPRTPLYTYPDASVICGPLEFDAQDPNRTTVINATLIAEVLSATTEADDRGEKFRRYLTLETLREYVLVSQVRPWIETFSRQGDGTWRFSTASGLDGSAKFDALQIELPLLEVYSGIEFPPELEPLRPI